VQLALQINLNKFVDWVCAQIVGEMCIGFRKVWICQVEYQGPVRS
jgi:hypothetical protein